MVMPTGATSEQARAMVLALYDAHGRQLYRFVHHRCRDVGLAEEITSETFLSALRTIAQAGDVSPSLAWLQTIARNKLIDHWRRREREDRALQAAALERQDDRWSAGVHPARAALALQHLTSEHRAVLVLRYSDGLAVADIAGQIGRSVHATESLLVRARRSFRAAYEQGGGDLDD